MSKIILDPTKLYQPLTNYIVINTEVEFLQYFTLENDGYWIKGERLCEWAKEYLRVWNKSSFIIEEKQDPRSKLEAILQPFSIPDNWDNQYILEIVTQLDNYNSQNSIEFLLADVTNLSQDFWLTNELSIQHLAQWLSITIPEKYEIFADFWLYHLINKTQADLVNYYKIENKEQLLKSWLGLNNDFDIINRLGQYPLTIPDFYLEEIKNFWRQKIYQTEAKILDQLILHQQAGKEIIASVAYSILLDNPSWITEEIITKISIYLRNQQTLELQEKLPPQQPLPLSTDATPQEALQWATEFYLPFRKWETTINITPKQEQISEQLADSFVNWIVKYYPELKLDNVEKSWLNYNVTAQVEKLAKNNPILWVVIDGLGWLDHQELIFKLTQENILSIKQDIKPKFSILPTKTEYAKWSLFTQLLPSHNSWKNNAGDGFSLINNGCRYTDKNKAKLIEDLQEKKYQIYCWDTTKLDQLYHHETDWKTLYELEREKILDGISKDILHFLAQYPEPENLQIIIASDHGQIIGEVNKINNYPNNLEAQGRMAIGITEDHRFVVLSAQRFGLPHDISIVRNQDSLGSFNYTKNQKIIGTHGGLFPEEVVVGFSILSKNISRLPVLIICKGEGKAKEKGELEIIIDNPNTVRLTNLCLYINEIQELKTGKILNIDVRSNKKINHILEIKTIPELPPDKTENYLSLSGKITFSFANTEVAEAKLDSQSLLTIEQIFTSGIKGGLDEFL